MFTLTKLKLDKQSNMIRIGFGKHKFKWFFRIDLWNYGYRITKKENNEK